MARKKYMQLKLRNLPNIVVQHYNIGAKATKDSYVYVEINQGCMVSCNQVSLCSNFYRNN